MSAAPTWTKFSEATKADLDAIEAEESRSAGLIPERLLEYLHSIERVKMDTMPLGAVDHCRQTATRAFRDGLVEVQDEASQLAALLVEARPEMAVADLCAGAGGKALALAAAMGNRGRLVALDSEAARLERARPRLARAGVTCHALQTLSGDDGPWLSAEAAGFDRVLVDAPCSGSGAWRRNPDARWRLTPEALAELLETQATLLDRAAALVRPGGRLIYATCSLLAEENGAQIESFLARATDFALKPYGEVWRAAIGSTPPDRAATLTLTPARHGTDGFFVAVLERGGLERGGPA